MFLALYGHKDQISLVPISNCTMLYDNVLYCTHFYSAVLTCPTLYSPLLYSSMSQHQSVTVNLMPDSSTSRKLYHSTTLQQLQFTELIVLEQVKEL